MSGSATAPNPGTLLDCVRMKRRVAVDLSVLRDSRNLRLLAIGEVLSGFGSQAVLVAIPFQVYVLTRSAALVGLLGLVELIPIIVFSLLGGAVADRMERRKLMRIGQTAIVTSAASLAAISIAGPAERMPRVLVGSKMADKVVATAREISLRLGHEEARAAGRGRRKHASARRR